MVTMETLRRRIKEHRVRLPEGMRWERATECRKGGTGEWYEHAMFDAMQCEHAGEYAGWEGRRDWRLGLVGYHWLELDGVVPGNVHRLVPRVVRRFDIATQPEQHLAEIELVRNVVSRDQMEDGVPWLRKQTYLAQSMQFVVRTNRT